MRKPTGGKPAGRDPQADLGRASGEVWLTDWPIDDPIVESCGFLVDGYPPCYILMNMTNSKTTSLDTESCRAAFFAGFANVPRKHLGIERGTDEAIAYSSGKMAISQNWLNDRTNEEAFAVFLAAP